MTESQLIGKLQGLLKGKPEKLLNIAVDAERGTTTVVEAEVLRELADDLIELLDDSENL